MFKSELNKTGQNKAVGLEPCEGVMEWKQSVSGKREKKADLQQID